MNALLTSPSLGLALLGLVVAAIVAMHRMKPRAVRRVVASTWLWEVAARRAGMRQSSWRWWLGLALSLAIGALLVVALTRPEVRGDGDGSRRVVVIVDDGPSMAMRRGDGRTRFAHAIDRARGLIRKAPGSVLVIDTMGRATAPDFTGSAEAFAALDRLTVVPAGDRVAPPLPDVPGLAVHLVGDGVGLPALPPGTIVHSVFELADNVAVLRLVARPRPADPLARRSARPGAQRVARREVRPPDVARWRAVRRHAASCGWRPANSSMRRSTCRPSRAVSSPPRPSRPATRSPATTSPTRSCPHTAHGACSSSRAAIPRSPTRSRRCRACGSRSSIRRSTATARRPMRTCSTGSRHRKRRTPVRCCSGRRPPAGCPRRIAASAMSRSTRGIAGIRSRPASRGTRWTCAAHRSGKRLPDGVAAVVRTGASAVVVSGRATAPWIAVAFGSSDSDLPLQPGFTVFLGKVLAHDWPGRTSRRRNRSARSGSRSRMPR